MELDQEKRGRRSWRLNENLFRYEENVKECKRQMKEFFTMNMYKGTSMEMVWDASKAYMRGILIHMNNRYRLKYQRQRKELEEEIKRKEKLLIDKPGDKKIKETITILKGQFNMLMADQVATNLLYAKHNTFCNANKPGRWLAYVLRKKQKAHTIGKIVYKGKEVFQQDIIKKAFSDYYAKLYTRDFVQDVDIDKFLREVNFFKLTVEQREGLNCPITSEEIMSAIKQLKMGKTPGTDGLTAAYYKNLYSEMIEPLKVLFNKIQKEGGVPPSWKTAFISLIPKEDQDCNKPENYRPISLLNTDYKIFAKILANRLMVVMQQMIHYDQSGFIKGRQMRNNVRQIVNLLEYLEKNNQIPAAFIFLDAEKAFDRLNWQFLFKVIEKMQFGEHFIQTIKAIYQDQTAQVIVNGNLTEVFRIDKGTRQGCPLSPLLFILSLEVLLNQIRESNHIKGLKIRQQDYRLRAFADDVVVTVTQPMESVVNMMEIITQYGKVSGFKVNQNKTKIIVKNMSIHQRGEIEQISGFEIVKKVKYLGVYITASNMKLYKNNYKVLWDKVQKDLENWKKLQLSLLGRIAAIKMNVLPRFLFLFQMIPVLKKDANLKEWQKGINNFIWLGKKARIKLKIMQDTRERGGLKMPNLRLYYEAVSLSLISDWFNLSEERILNVEGYDLLYGWHAYLLYDKKVDRAFKNHILRSALLRVWKRYQYKLNYKIPIWANPRHAIENISIEQKQERVTYKELLVVERDKFQLKSINILKQEKIICTWFQYGQLQARWKEDQRVGIMQKEENLVKQIKDQGHSHIKRLYNALVEIDSETELVKDCMIKWAQNIQEPIMMETWEKIWVTNVKFTQAQNLRENFYKMFYRWHLDPKKLSCMYPNVQPKCWRCDCEDATYYHIWWTCKKIKAFWIKIWWIIQNVLKKKIKFTPQFFLLGIITDFSVIETKLILNFITAARLLIAQYWKKEDVPTTEEWTLKVANLAEMAKVSAYLKDCKQERYIVEWKRWIDYIQNKYGTTKYQIAYE